MEIWNKRFELMLKLKELLILDKLIWIKGRFKIVDRKIGFMINKTKDNKFKEIRK